MVNVDVVGHVFARSSWLQVPSLLNLHCNRSQALRLRLRLRLSWPHWQPLTIGTMGSSRARSSSKLVQVQIEYILQAAETLSHYLSAPLCPSLFLPLLLDLFLCCLTAPPAAAEKINQDLHMLAHFYYIYIDREASRGIYPPCLSASFCTIYFVIKYNHSA